jgi:hypothetical protein
LKPEIELFVESLRRFQGVPTLVAETADRAKEKLLAVKPLLAPISPGYLEGPLPELVLNLPRA